MSAAALCRRFACGAIAVLFATVAAAFDCPELEYGAQTVDPGGYPAGLLWRVEAPSGGESYVFGTIHISDPRVTRLHPAVSEAFARSAHFTMEVVFDAGTVRKMARAMYFQDNQALSQLLPDDLYERVVALLAGYGVSGAAASKLKPWAAYTTLSLPPDQHATPLDLMLLNAAQAAGKTVSGLETLDEQIAVFDDLSERDQLELLELTICHYDSFQAEVAEMIAYYETGDLAGMMRMAVRYESPSQERFMDVLLRQRNHRMVERMRKRLERGGAFVAIGALHLPGPEGVLKLLQSDGFSITRVY
ncbi:MAG: TraB/GumN family protein [Gammaproteobacteria bacterium]|jgi:uncharacterized protein YbaP (TraB family)